MAVVIFHYKSKYLETLPVDSDLREPIYFVTKFGYLGVHLFFLISGYVIFSSAQNCSSLQFMISRGTRIFPTLWTCVTITILMVFMIHGFGDISLYKYFANFTLLYTYLGVEAIDIVYWTLVIEVKFYACIFVLMLLGWLKYYRIWIPIWLAATICYIFLGQPFFLGWIISPEYSPYFISGIIFSLAQREGYRPLYIAVLGIAMLMALRYAFVEADRFSETISTTFPYLVVAVVFTFFAIFYLLSREKITLGYNRIYLVLGAMTYPLYLLHNANGKIIFDRYVDVVHPLLLLVLITLAIMILCYLINIFVEKKLANRLKHFLYDVFSIHPQRSRQYPDSGHTTKSH